MVPGQLVHQADSSRASLAEPVADAAEQFQGLALAGHGGGVVPGLPLHAAEFAQHVGLVELRADGAK